MELYPKKKGEFRNQTDIQFNSFSKMRSNDESPCLFNKIIFSSAKNKIVKPFLGFVWLEHFSVFKVCSD